jgi:outer membrane immunogenic protein
MITTNADVSEALIGWIASVRLRSRTTAIERQARDFHERISAKPRGGLSGCGACAARLFAATLGLLAICGPARSADLSPPLAPAPLPTPYSWSGLYIGLNAGYASARVTDTFSGAGLGSATSNLPGGIGGVQIGANYQFGAVVLGFEADFDGNMATKSVIVGGNTTGTNQIPWIGTLRGRVGYAFDRLLFYATAGGAATQLYSTLNVGAITSATTTDTHGAWTAGGGLEAAITDNLSARIEYLYLDTGTINVAQLGPPFVTVTGRVQDNLVRAALNYRLPVAW